MRENNTWLSADLQWTIVLLCERKSIQRERERERNSNRPYFRSEWSLAVKVMQLNAQLPFVGPTVNHELSIHNQKYYYTYSVIGLKTSVNEIGSSLFQKCSRFILLYNLTTILNGINSNIFISTHSWE